MSRPRVLAIVGPTAAGKTALSLKAAEMLGAEIVSIDSAMPYRGMDIGTDKPPPGDLARIRHHLIDIVEPDRTLTVSTFQALARAAIAGIVERGRVPLLVGGSGLYFRAVVDPLEFPGTDPQIRLRLETEAAALGPGALYDRLRAVDPVAAARIDPPNVRRTVRALEVLEVTGRPFSSFRTAWKEAESVYDVTIVGVTWPREQLDQRIDARVESQISRGLVEEVQRLVDAGFRASVTSVQALGYAQILGHLDGRLTLAQAEEEIKLRTRRFARRQERWFRADSRISWYPSDPSGAAEHLLASFHLGTKSSDRKGTAA